MNLVDQERTFVIHWEDTGKPASPIPAVESLAEIIRPRSMSIDFFEDELDSIEYWPKSIIEPLTNEISYPSGTRSGVLFNHEYKIPELGLTKLSSKPEGDWCQWVSDRIELAKRCGMLVSPDDTIDILLWGETKLSLLPLMSEGDEWFFRQKLAIDQEFTPILDVIIALQGGKIRITDLLVTVYSAAYSTEYDLKKTTAGACDYSWLSLFLDANVSIFHRWLVSLVNSYPGCKWNWHAEGTGLFGTKLDDVFSQVFGPPITPS